jgi:hypothetical protein
MVVGVFERKSIKFWINIVFWSELCHPECRSAIERSFIRFPMSDSRWITSHKRPCHDKRPFSNNSFSNLFTEVIHFQPVVVSVPLPSEETVLPETPTFFLLLGPDMRIPETADKPHTVSSTALHVAESQRIYFLPFAPRHFQAVLSPRRLSPVDSPPPRLRYKLLLQ